MKKLVVKKELANRKPGIGGRTGGIGSVADCQMHCEGYKEICVCDAGPRPTSRVGQLINPAPTAKVNVNAGNRLRKK